MPPDEMLPDEAIVVRCGIPPFDQPTNLPGRCRHHCGLYGLSVQSSSVVTVDVLASWCKNGYVGVSTVARLRALGYDIIKTRGEGYHATLVVPLDWPQEAAEIVAREFQTLKNAHKGQQLC